MAAKKREEQKVNRIGCMTQHKSHVSQWIDLEDICSFFSPILCTHKCANENHKFECVFIDHTYICISIFNEKFTTKSKLLHIFEKKKWSETTHRTSPDIKNAQKPKKKNNGKKNRSTNIGSNKFIANIDILIYFSRLYFVFILTALLVSVDFFYSIFRICCCCFNTQETYKPCGIQQWKVRNRKFFRRF